MSTPTPETPETLEAEANRHRKMRRRCLKKSGLLFQKAIEHKREAVAADAHAAKLRRSASTAAASEAGEAEKPAACLCGRELLYHKGNTSDPDPWCSGCSQSASVCDCAHVFPAPAAKPVDGEGEDGSDWVPDAQSFQAKVGEWTLACFGTPDAQYNANRVFRFFEEAIELAQSFGCSKSEAMQLVDYVFDRPVGRSVQEVGGVMVTLAALCSAFKINLEACADFELKSVWAKIDKIRAKQAAKMQGSPLPGFAHSRSQAVATPPMDAMPLFKALKSAEAALSDIGDAEGPVFNKDGTESRWTLAAAEKLAREALPEVRAALAAARPSPAPQAAPAPQGGGKPKFARGSVYREQSESDERRWRYDGHGAWSWKKSAKDEWQSLALEIETLIAAGTLVPAEDGVEKK